MVGICDAAVAAVPLVSLPVSPSVWSAARAPPLFTLSERVKYGLPSCLGMTKTFRPVFRLPDAAAPVEEPAAADDGELEELEEQAASATATEIATASHDARLSFMSLYPFNSRVSGSFELGAWVGGTAARDGPGRLRGGCSALAWRQDRGC